MTEISPRIEKIRWGKVTLEDGRRFKDVKLYPGGAREWDWSETGTGHTPGVQFADVQELLDHGASVIVLSRGQMGRLRVPAITLHALEELGVEIHVQPTAQAVETYNQLRAEKAVGALIHSTC